MIHDFSVRKYVSNVFGVIFSFSILVHNTQFTSYCVPLSTCGVFLPPLLHWCSWFRWCTVPSCLCVLPTWVELALGSPPSCSRSRVLWASGWSERLATSTTSCSSIPSLVAPIMTSTSTQWWVLLHLQLHVRMYNDLHGYLLMKKNALPFQALITWLYN